MPTCLRQAKVSAPGPASNRAFLPIETYPGRDMQSPQPIKTFLSQASVLRSPAIFRGVETEQGARRVKLTHTKLRDTCEEERRGYIDWIYWCQNPYGGFRGFALPVSEDSNTSYLPSKQEETGQ